MNFASHSFHGRSRERLDSVAEVSLIRRTEGGGQGLTLILQRSVRENNNKVFVQPEADPPEEGASESELRGHFAQQNLTHRPRIKVYYFRKEIPIDL